MRTMANTPKASDQPQPQPQPQPTDPNRPADPNDPNRPRGEEMNEAAKAEMERRKGARPA
jgi:hypothetical protein